MAQPAPKMSREEYLELTLTSDIKYEFVNHELVAMSGGRPVHAALCMNVSTALHVHLLGRGGTCRPTTSDQRLYVEATDSHFYPDVQVICGRYELALDRLSVLNPTVIVEVLSPSTRDYDLGVKWAHYRRIPSLQTYLLVDPENRSVLAYTRNEAGWQFTEHLDGSVRLGALDFDLPLAAVFGNLESVPLD
jgi:Uma2 family endonuclease